jgi:hypothetical protein
MTEAKVVEKLGRPTDYTLELADSICERLANGESMRSVCRDDSMPAMTTIFRWLREDEPFKQQYSIATEERTEAMAEDILDIADNGTNDWMSYNASDDEGYKLNGEALQRSKLRVDTRKWHMSKMKPKKYGVIIQQEITAPEGVTFNMNYGESK